MRTAAALAVEPSTTGAVPSSQIRWLGVNRLSDSHPLYPIICKIQQWWRFQLTRRQASKLIPFLYRPRVTYHKDDIGLAPYPTQGEGYWYGGGQDDMAGYDYYTTSSWPDSQELGEPD